LIVGSAISGRLEKSPALIFLSYIFLFWFCRQENAGEEMRTCGFLSSLTMAETPNNFSFSAKEISKTDLKVSEPQETRCNRNSNMRKAIPFYILLNKRATKKT
jgi:hypothetical protein